MRPLFAVLASFLLATAAVAHNAQHGALKLGHPHAAPVEEGKSTDLLLTLSNGGAPDRLIAIETEMAKRVELKPVAVPTGAKDLQVRAKLVGATRSYGDTEMIPATFVFEKAGRVVEDIMIDK